MNLNHRDIENLPCQGVIYFLEHDEVDGTFAHLQHGIMVDRFVSIFSRLSHHSSIAKHRCQIRPRLSLPPTPFFSLWLTSRQENSTWKETNKDHTGVLAVLAVLAVE